MTAATALHEHVSKYIDAALTAAWLRRCGPSGIPGKWHIPGEFMDVGELAEAEISVYPLYASLREDGSVSGWSAHLTNKDTHGWEWRLNVGWDDLTQPQIDAIEDIGGCFDDHEVTFLILGSHAECPPISDELVNALVLLCQGEPQ